MRVINQYLNNKRGSVAVEFALVSLLTILVIVFLMFASLVVYINQVLDYATSQATRQILTGAAQTSALSRAAFRTSLCSYLPAAMKCSDISINLFVVTKGANPSGYYSFANSNMTGLAIPDASASEEQYNLGARGDFQYLQVIYPITFAPPMISSWLSGNSTYKGAPAYLAMSTAAFRNEQF